LPRAWAAKSRAVLAYAGGHQSEPRPDEGHHGGGVAAAVSGGAAAELPAGKTVPAQRWADGVASAQASPSQDTPRDQNKGAPAHSQNEWQQIEIASHHGIARPRGEGRGTFRGARPPGEYLAAGARAPGALERFVCRRNGVPPRRPLHPFPANKSFI